VALSAHVIALMKIPLQKLTSKLEAKDFSLAFFMCAVHAHVLAGCESLSQPDGGEV